MELANRRLSSQTSTSLVVTSCSQWSQWRHSHDWYSQSKKANSDRNGRSGDVRVIGVQKFKKQAKKKTPTDLDRALLECGPTSPDSTLFFCVFSKNFLQSWLFRRDVTCVFVEHMVVVELCSVLYVADGVLVGGGACDCASDLALNKVKHHCARRCTYSFWPSFARGSRHGSCRPMRRASSAWIRWRVLLAAQER